MSELFRFSMYTTSDDEFFAPTNLFSLQDIIQFSKILKNVCFLLGGMQLNPVFEYFCGSLTQSLRLIYIRDSRRPFCTKDHWLLPLEKENWVNVEAGSKNAWILANIPFVIPFETRVAVFREWVWMDKESLGLNGWSRAQGPFTIHRNTLFEDGFRGLNPLGSRLKQRIKIQFVSEQGLPEAGNFKDFYDRYRWRWCVQGILDWTVQDCF